MTNLRFPFLIPIAFCYALHAAAATVTLSQNGIIALDYRAPGPSASILRAQPSQGGVEYTISVRSHLGGVHLFSESGLGKGLLVGLPWTPGDRLGLRFTLLPTPVRSMTLGAGVTINGAYGSVNLTRGQTTVESSTASGAGGTAIEMIGFHLDFVSPAGVAWPDGGAVVQVLVQPLPGALQLEPRLQPSPLPDTAPGHTITLTAADLQTLQVPSYSHGKASLLSAVPSESGVLYTFQFRDNRGSIALELPAGSPLLGTRLSGSDSFALKFTVKGNTPGPGSGIGAGALVNIDGQGRSAHAPVFLYSTRPAELTSDTGTGATAIKKLGIVVFIPPSEQDDWPATGSIVQILVEPAPDAIPVQGMIESQ